MTKRLLITGSRTWKDQEIIADAIYGYWVDNGHGELTIVHGDCPTGADALADWSARIFGFNIEEHPADWSKGRKAGPIRNKEMVDSKPDACYAFIKDNSKGATGCANLAQKAGIPTTIWTE